MNRRLVGMVLALTGLSCAEEEGNVPPINSATTPMSTTATGSGSTDTDATGTGSESGSESSSSTGGPFVALTGSLNDGGGGYALPITCTVRFHSPGEIEPSSGTSTGFTFARPFVVDQFPQSWEITSEQAGGMVSRDDTGFVTTACDVDGDGLFDDNSGGYFPTLPLLEITLPASGIDLVVGPL